MFFCSIVSHYVTVLTHCSAGIDYRSELCLLQFVFLPLNHIYTFVTLCFCLQEGGRSRPCTCIIQPGSWTYERNENRPKAWV